MVKRRQSASNDLRTTPLALSLHKYDTSMIKTSMQQYWNINNIQPFFPPVEKLFKTDDLENVSDYGIRFDQELLSVNSANTIRTSSGTISYHKKVSMLLSPYKWMQGDYGSTLGLPTRSEHASLIYGKLQNHNNAAYVGAMLSAALSQSGCQHFPAVYGLFTGTSEHHKIDISDDYGDLCDRSWFSQNLGKTFNISLSDEIKDQNVFSHTRTARMSIQLGDETTLDNVPELATTHVDANIADMNKMFTDDGDASQAGSDDSDVSTSYIFGIKSCECDDEEDDQQDDEESIEPYAWATFDNVPVQITVMEKCEGTMYQLITMNAEPEKHLAWISQLMFALAYAQRNFALTHNDLHANNVMYVPTKSEYFYYNCAGTLYRVPTYGYLIKVIDFERGVGQVKLVGMKEPKLFMSDQFSVNEEAGGQYNYDEFYTAKYPDIKPNPSFDLVRFATSMFWDLFPEGPECTAYSENMVYKLFMKWLTLEDGNSVLFGKNDPKHDRYHGFHLYKAIARYCKDTAVPRKEILSLKPFYEVETVPAGTSVLLIEF